MDQPIIYIDEKATPYGRIVVGASKGKILLSGFAPLSRSEVPPGYLTKHQSTATTRKALGSIHDYLAGKKHDLKLPVLLIGTPFQKRVWRALGRIGYGQTLSYGQLAKRIGSPDAARAIGMACNRNRLGIIIPCHRVIGAGGDLVGYAGGLSRKRKLLRLEGCSLSA